MIDSLEDMASVLNRFRRTTSILFAKQLLQYLSKTYLNFTISQEGYRWWDADRSRVGAVANIIYTLYKLDHQPDLLVNVIKAGSITSLPIQRACTLAVSKFGDPISSLLDTLLGLWADKFSITHTPVMVQEGMSPFEGTYISSYANALVGPFKS
jgi:hypothetical protein